MSFLPSHNPVLNTWRASIINGAISCRTNADNVDSRARNRWAESTIVTICASGGFDQYRDSASSLSLQSCKAQKMIHAAKPTRHEKSRAKIAGLQSRHIESDNRGEGRRELMGDRWLNVDGGRTASFQASARLH